MNPSKLMEVGYAFVCACCLKLHCAMDRGLEYCEHAHDDSCGGPLKGRAFPKYEGPLTKEMFALKCFRCGEQADFLVELPRGAGFLGTCKEHSEMLRPKSSQAVVLGPSVPKDYPV